MPILDARFRQRGFHLFLGELRNLCRSRDRPHINQPPDFPCGQQLDKLLPGSRGVADREKRSMRHRRVALRSFGQSFRASHQLVQVRDAHPPASRAGPSAPQSFKVFAPCEDFGPRGIPGFQWRIHPRQGLQRRLCDARAIYLVAAPPPMTFRPWSASTRTTCAPISSRRGDRHIEDRLFATSGPRDGTGFFLYDVTSSCTPFGL